MKSELKDYEIFFCGISKNCIKTIDKNLDFLSNFIKNSKFKSYIILIDSDSSDGTKEHIEKFIANDVAFLYQNLDGLENNYPNRIERIQISRNKCIELIPKLTKNSNLVYVPLDLDLDLFKYTSPKKLDELIEYCISKKEPNGIFPFSSPYYYDIFALRSNKWVNKNSLFWVDKLKKCFKFGSFFYNYFFIFRYQITASKFKTIKNLKIRSAFGGMGIYKLGQKIPNYQLSIKNPAKVSEHLKFNFHFNELEILTTWNVPAPQEHLEFKLLEFNSKIKYFFKTLFFDFVNKK